MKKVIFYSTFIFVCGIALLGWDLYKIFSKIDMNASYYKSQLSYENTEPHDVGILKDSAGNLKYFKVVGQTTDHKLCIQEGTNPSFVPKDIHDKILFNRNGNQVYIRQEWVGNLYNNHEAWDDRFTILTQTELLDLTANTLVYYYKRAMFMGDKPNKLSLIPIGLGYIFGLYLIAFLILYIQKNILTAGSKLLNFFTPMIIIVVAVLVGAFFAQSFSSTLFFLFLFKNLISFFLVYLAILSLNKKWDHMDFGKRELYKFFTITFLVIAIEMIGGHLLNYLYFEVFGHDGGLYYEFGTMTTNLGWMKFWIYFVIANFMSNLTFYIITLKNRDKIVNLQKRKELSSASSLATMQSRINPHFLYNALNSIASLARTEPTKTEKMALQLAKFYDKCSHLNSKPMISLAEELDLLDAYLMIEKIRFGERLDAILPTQNDKMDMMIPSFILQPLVENAIKYGYDSTTDKIKIKITTRKNEDDLTIRIFDTGEPFPEDMVTGYGLRSIVKKLKLLYPDKHTISFTNDPEKYVEIKIHL